MEVSSTGCWEWCGEISSGGYGRCWLEGRHLTAHRVIWQWYYGDIPQGLELNHKCNNTACVNPAHLEVVTHKQNREYCVAQGRQARGEAIAQSKLTHTQVAEIRTRYAAGGISQRGLARAYGVHHKVIWIIVNDLGWKGKANIV